MVDKAIAKSDIVEGHNNLSKIKLKGRLEPDEN